MSGWASSDSSTSCGDSTGIKSGNGSLRISGWHCPHCRILWETDSRQGEARHRVATQGCCRPVPVAGEAYRTAKLLARDVRKPTATDRALRADERGQAAWNPASPGMDRGLVNSHEGASQSLTSASAPSSNSHSDGRRSHGQSPVWSTHEVAPRLGLVDCNTESGRRNEVLPLLNFNPVTVLGAASTEASLKLMDVAVGLRMLSNTRATALLQAVRDPEIQQILMDHPTPRQLFQSLSSDADTSPWMTVDVGQTAGVCQRFGYKPGTILFRYKDPECEARCLARAAAKLGYHLHTRPIPQGDDGEQGHPMQGQKAAEIWSAIGRFARAYSLDVSRLGFLMVLLWSDGTFVGRQGWVNGEQARISLQNAPLDFIRSDCGSRMVAIFPHVKVKGQMTEGDVHEVKEIISRECWVILMSSLAHSGAAAAAPEHASVGDIPSALGEGRFEEDLNLSCLMGTPTDMALTVALGVFQADMKEIWDRLGLTHKRPVHVVVPGSKQCHPSLLRSLVYEVDHQLDIPSDVGVLRTPSLQEEHVRLLRSAEGNERGMKARRQSIRSQCGQRLPYKNFLNDMPWGRHTVVIEEGVGDDTTRPQGHQDGMEAVSSSDLLHEYYKGLFEHLLAKVQAYTECALHQHHHYSKARAKEAWSTVSDRMRTWGRDCLSGTDIEVPSDLTRQVSQTNGEELKGISRVLAGALHGICPNDNVVKLVYLFQLSSYEREASVFTTGELEEQSRHTVAFCLGLGALHKHLFGCLPQVPKMVESALSAWDALRHGSVAYRNVMVMEKTQADLKEGLGSGPRNMPSKCSEVACQFVNFLQQQKVVAHCQARSRTLSLLGQLDPGTFGHLSAGSAYRRRVLSASNAGCVPPRMVLEDLVNTARSVRLEMSRQRYKPERVVTSVPDRVFTARRTCSSKHGKGFKLNLGDIAAHKDDLQHPAHGVLQRGYALDGRAGRSFKQVPDVLVREAQCMGLLTTPLAGVAQDYRSHPDSTLTIIPQVTAYDMRDPTSPGPAITIKGHPALGVRGEREHYCAYPQFVRVDNTASGGLYNRSYVGMALVIVRLCGRTSRIWRSAVEECVSNMLHSPEGFMNARRVRENRTVQQALRIERDASVDFQEDYQASVEDWALRLGPAVQAPREIDQYYVLLHKYDEVWGGGHSRGNVGLAGPVGQPLWEPSYSANRQPRVQAVPLGAVDGRAPMFYEFQRGSTRQHQSGRAYMLSLTSNTCPVSDPPWLGQFVSELLDDADDALFAGEAPLHHLGAPEQDSSRGTTSHEDDDSPQVGQARKRRRLPGDRLL